MFKDINWNEPSTKRGAVWIVAFIFGIPMVYMGKDVSQLLLLATGIVGGMGLLIKDIPEQSPE